MKGNIEVKGADRGKYNMLRIGAVVLSLVTVALVILQLFMPALNVGEQTGSGFAINTYSGIDVAFICWPAFILGGELIGPNAVLIAGIVLSIILGLVLGLMLIKAHPAKAKIYSTILAVIFAYFAITWLNLGSLVLNTAYDKFMELVHYAKENGMYGINAYAVITSIVALLAAACNAAFAYISFGVAKTVPLDEKEKKAMTTKKATLIFAPVIAVVLVLVTTATTLMNYYSGVMDNFFGQGKIKSSGTDVSSEYYDGLLDEVNYSTKEASKKFAENANRTIVEEGIALLKNEGNTLPLSGNANITLLGANMNLAEGLTAAGFNVLDSTTEATASGLIETGFKGKSSYSSNSDAAIVTIYRSYGEGNDAKTVAADGVRTELSLSEAELELLDNACKSFDKVIVLMATSNVMECSYLTAGKNYVDPYFNTDKTYDFSHIKGAFWISSRIGGNGAEALAEILNGSVNPSGHLVDTYVKDLTKDPTYVNYGDFTYTNGDLGQSGYRCNPTTPAEGYTKTSFVDYEEGIYSGYRYYETAAYEASAGNYEGFDYEDTVVYPFGYGLSYTTFDMEYDSEPVFDEATNSFTFPVKVTNTGSVSGKQVAQIYLSAPYTKGGIEKSHVVLVGYGKTSVLEPGASEVLNITIDRDYICSYDYKDAKCYVLDAGDYNFILSENAHSWADNDTSKVWTYSLSEKIVYDENNKRSSDFVAAVNQLDEVTNWKFKDNAQTGTGYSVNFSRSDFAGTYPTAPEGGDLTAQDRVLQSRKKFNTEDVDTYIEDIVITDSTMTSYTLADMRGVDYNDEKWEQFIEQLSEDKLIEMFSNGNWQEVADTDNGVPRSVDLDGPQGLTAQALGTQDCQVYQVNIMIGGTWNTDMAALMGTSIANEMMAYGWTGWYGPGMNIHRSPFGGRACEYYSEDPILSGTMGAAEVAACAEGGVICFNKHYAFNNQEVNRQGNICTWLNEQAAREVYLRGWEYYVKECKMQVQYYETDESGNIVKATKEMPGANGVMTSYNLVGADWTAASTETTVNILRKEWNFTGTSLTDAINNATEYMDPTQALYSGASDIALSQVSLGDTDNDLALKNLQMAAKNVLYNKANSNVLQLNGLLPGANISYGLAPWKKGLIAAWVLTAALFAAGLCWVLNVKKNEKKAAVKA